MMRPVITDFSSGELSPKLAGRMDLPIYYSGAQEMTNFIPGRLGGAFKRGGFQYKLASAVQGSAARLIPWSIDNETDLLVELSDGAIRFIDVSGGMDPAYLTGTGIPMVELRPGTAAYAAADIATVRYAQNNREITFTHKDYPIFRIKFLSKESTTLTLEYGVVQIIGNIAWNPPGSIDDEGIEYSSFQLYEAVSSLAGGGAITADAGSFITISEVQHPITSIQVAKTNAASVMTIRQKTLFFGEGHNHISYTSTPVNEIQAPVYGTSGWNILYSPGWRFGAWDWRVDLPMSGIDIIDYYKEKIGTDGKWKDLTLGKQGSLETINTTLSVKMDWDPESWTITIVYDTGTKVIVDTAEEYVRMSLTIADRDIHMSGAVVNSANVLDYTLPWMKRDAYYPCDPGMQISGKTPLSAIKRIVQDDDSKRFGQEYLEVNFGSDVMLNIYRDTTGLTGSVGVIVTPYYQDGDNPDVCCYHQGRLVLAGGRNPNSVFMSKVNDHANFCFFEDIEFSRTELKPQSEWLDELVPETRTETDTTQQVGAANAIGVEIATDENEQVAWMVSAGDLIIGTATTEWVIPAGITAMNVQAIQTSRNGSASVQARFIGNSIVFPSRSSRQVRAYSPQDRGMSVDIMQYSEHITGGSAIVAMDFRQDPAQEVYCLLANGKMLRLTLDGGMPCWSRIETDGIIETLAIVPASDEDALYTMVRRTIDGTTVRSIERLVTADESTLSLMARLDSFTRVANTGAGTVTGQTRFDADPLGVIFKTSSGDYQWGTIQFTAGSASTYTDPYGYTIPIPANAEMVYGLPFTATLKTFRIDSQETEGVPKAGGPLHLRLYKSGTFNIIREEDGTSYEIALPDVFGADSYPYTGAVRVEHDAPERTDHAVIVESSDAQPVNILVVAPTYSVGGA